MGDTSNLDMTFLSAIMLMIIAPMMIIGVMLLTRKTERRAAMFLAFFLILVSLNLVPQVIGFSGFYTVWPGLTFAPFEYGLFLGPLLYLHIRSLVSDDPLKWRWALLIPGMIQFAYYVWAFTALGDYEAKWAYNREIHYPYVWPTLVVGMAVLLLVSLVLSLRELKAYKNYLGQTQSAASEFKPVWLNRFLIFMAILTASLVVTELGDVFVWKFSYVEKFPILALMAAAVLLMGFEALTRLTMDFPKIRALTDSTTVAAPAGRDWAEEADKLETRLKSESWHLEPRLTISDIARRMGTNETYISRALNNGRGVNFNRFVNAVRVEAASDMMREEPGKNLLTLALDSGFNSKATFNRVFKDITGQSPSQYRASRV